MPEAEAAEASSSGGQKDVQNQLAQLVPTYDPGVDSVETWSQKIELLLRAWPETKLSELATRIVLNTKGSAFQKLQLHQAELFTGDRKGIERIVSLVGGSFGQVDLEKKFEIAERALYRCVQKADETADSFLARSDNTWTELLGKKMTLAELQAYVILRGSRLAGDDKKRVLVESGAEDDGTLKMIKVQAAIRMLGSTFFQDYTYGKKDKNQKTYDHTAFLAEEHDDAAEDWPRSNYDDWGDDDFEHLAGEDDDAALVVQFENAMLDSLQEDRELSAFFTSYQEARKRLVEKTKSRGYWGISKGKGGKKGYPKGKGKGYRPKSLAQRIAESACRRCGQIGHWKSECPLNANVSGDSKNVMPTTAVVDHEVAAVTTTTSAEPNDVLSSYELLKDIPEWADPSVSLHELDFCLHVMTHEFHGNTKFRIGLKKRLQDLMSMKPRFQKAPVSEPVVVSSIRPSVTSGVKQPEEYPNLFCSSGTIGVVDLGASQSVIGSAQLQELLQQLKPDIRKSIRKQKVDLVFRFGNNQTLQSSVALVFPLHSEWIRVAVVQGKTPFLLSSNFLQTIGAVIDTQECTLWSKLLGRYVPVTKNPKNLMLMNINDLWETDFAAMTVTVNASTHGDNRPDVSCQLPESKTFARSTEQSSRAAAGEVFEGPPNQHFDEDFQTLVVPPRVDSAVENMCMDNNVVVGSKPSHQQSCAASNTCGSHVIARSVSDLPCQERWRESRKPDTGSISWPENRLRKSQDESDLRGGFPRPGVDKLHGVQIREERQASSSEVPSLCETANPVRAEHSPEEQRCQNSRHQDQGEEPRCDLAHGDASGGRGGLRVGRDVHPPSEAQGRDLSRGGESSQPHGGSPGPSDFSSSTALYPRSTDSGQGRTSAVDQLQTSEESAREFEAMVSDEYFAGSLDYDHAGFQQQKNYQRECQRLIVKFRKELRDVQHVIKPGRHKSTLFEVMCSHDSELTRQCQQLGYKARRFGLAEGDLNTTHARRKLFAHLISERPDHLWYSPECAPWCRWSTMNMSKSLESLTHVLDARWQKLWQVALGVVLFEHQVTNGQHFHLEQPDGSAMLKLPTLGSVIHVALPCKFDMCIVGGLVDPQSKMPIRKRMVVCTTSAEMRKALDHRKCPGEHPHFPVAGSTKVDDQTVPVSKFTEKYPRKFARQVCRILGHRNQYHSHEVLANEVSDSEEAESHPTKRRRLGEKSSPLQIALRSTTVTWENVMQAADLQAPRVGPLVVDHGDLLTAIGTLCPDHVIHHVVLCRGTDRMVGPNQHMIAGEAPWRRMICIRRNFEDICLEPEWEKWERLSHRQLRRDTTPARCSLTIFARLKYKSWSDDQDDENAAENQAVDPNSLPSGTVKRTGSSEVFEELVDRQKRYRSGMAEEVRGFSPSVPLQDTSNVKVDGETRQMIDLVSQKHGPNMIALPQSDQSWLLKLHRNLGHPSKQKMEYVCKQLGCNAEILRAIPDIRCSTCLESRGPEIPRPGAVKEELDFGDIVAMDGVTWKNSQGQQFHFYHMIDHSTSFHVAYCSPSRTAESVIRALTMGWIMWAGPPGQLILDAAGEFCDEKIQEFSQKHDIGLKVIPPEAHWQNGRCERHGGILQEMLTKMDVEEGINSYDQLEQALSFATQTKNQWSRHRGYPPELLVFGKMKKQPASITSDPSLASHALASSECAEGIRFRAELAVRESARKAFVQVDNDQACRRAILQRTRPNRGKYNTGDWIMMWRENKRWFGPMRVIQQDADHCIWAVFGSRMYRASPEQVRSLSAVEEIQHKKEAAVESRPDVVQISLNQPLENQQIPSAEAPAEEAISGSQISQGESPEPEPSVGTPSVANTEDVELERQINAPVGIPVPAETDDDLVCEVLHVTENQCWEIPIDLGLHEINQLLNKPEEEHSAFLVSAAKKQRSEVKLKDLSNQERELFEKCQGQRNSVLVGYRNDPAHLPWSDSP